MTHHNKLSSIILLSASDEGKILSKNISGETVPLLDHDKELAVIFIPMLLVELPLVYNDYALYLFHNKEHLELKINNVQQEEQHAIILIGDSDIREAYFIENKTLRSSTPLEIGCEYHEYLLNRCKPNNNGKVICDKNNLANIKQFISYIRDCAKLGNEAGITKSRTGNTVFSRNFGPCNPIIAKRKTDNQFVIYHSDCITMVRGQGGAGDFLESIDNGDGPLFTLVLQNPNSYKSRLKAPIIAGKLTVLFNDENVCRISFTEGYSAIACINNTIIVTMEMLYFKDETEKNMLINQYNLPNLGTARVLDLEKELIPMVNTRQDIQKQYEIEKNNSLLAPDYTKLLQQLGVFKVEETKPSIEQSKQDCCHLM